MAKLFNIQQIAEASKLLAEELFASLDRRAFGVHEGHIMRALRQTKPHLDEELTNGEILMAQIRALNAVQDKLLDDLQSLHDGDGGADDEEAGAELIASNNAELIDFRAAARAKQKQRESEEEIKWTT